MKINKSSLILVAVLIAGAVLGTNFVRDTRLKNEKTRLTNMLNPVIAKAVEGTSDPKPVISFVVPSDQSVVVVLHWDLNPEPAIKNDMRERLLTSVRRELSADPASWGRYVSIIFDNEVSTQGWK